MEPNSVFQSHGHPWVVINASILGLFVINASMSNCIQSEVFTLPTHPLKVTELIGRLGDFNEILDK